mmetsp:Transcript_22582/g.67352  ORF Transcript_22582/g.67352 Transcript_22582/m.67352 type:complete len:238 (-) Transcript_22582:176-889(-)
MFLALPSMFLLSSCLHARPARVPAPPAMALADTLPMQPDASLDVSEAVRVMCTGLEFNGFPHADAGVERLFHWMTPQGRVKLAPPPPRHGTQTGVELDYFLEHAGGAALGALLLCSRYQLVGAPRVMPATNAHGKLATVMVDVYNEPADLALTAALDRPASCGAMLDAQRDGAPLTDAILPPVSAMRRRSRFIFSLEQQRRPPHIGAWLLKEAMPMDKTPLQRYAELGEEFEGPDTD